MQSQVIAQCMSPSYQANAYRFRRPQSPTSGIFQRQVYWQNQSIVDEKLYYLQKYYTHLNSQNESKIISSFIEKIEIEDDFINPQQKVITNAQTQIIASEQINNPIEPNNEDNQIADEQLQLPQDYEKNIIKNAVHSCCRYILLQRKPKLNKKIMKLCQNAGVSFQSFLELLRTLKSNKFPSMYQMRYIYLNPNQQDPIYEVKWIFRQYFDHFINQIYEGEIRRDKWRIKDKQKYYNYTRQYLCYLIQSKEHEGNQP